MKKNKIYNKKKKGAALFLLVVMIGVAALILAINASFLGRSELNIGLTSSKGDEVESIVDGCGDEVIHRIRKDNTYGLSGVINLNLGSGSCIITVTDLGGGQRQVLIAGNLSYYNNKIQITLTILNNKIIVNDWQELTN